MSTRTLVSLFLAMANILPISIQAQSGTVAAGGKSTGSGGSITYSIGLVDYITASGSGGTLSEGLQQPYNCAGVIVNSQLNNISICSGSDTGFTISNVTGTAPINYQWQLSTNNGTTYSNIIGETINHLSLSNIPFSNNGYKYRCLISNSCGSVFSTAATIAVNQSPVATITPNGSTSFCGNNNVVLVSNTASSYQWYKNNALISGATYQTYTATATGKYSVQITNATGCTGSSSQIQVTKNPLPSTVLTTSGSTTFCNGDSVVITASTNASNPTFQWYKNFVLINGATSSIYSAKTTGKYYVIITNTNTGCTKASSNVSVTVNCKTTNEILRAINLNVYPNPASDLINLVFNSEVNVSGKIEIYNTLSELIYSKSIDIISGENNVVIDLGDVVKGVYFLKLSTGTQSYNLKIVKN